MLKHVILIAITVIALNLTAQTGVEGRWRTIDDVTGKMKSIVELSIKNGKLYGKVVSVSNPADKDNVCTLCTDYRKGQKIVGMEIISALKKDGSEWVGDDAILDPENGKTYDCKLWIEDGKLQVRGYIGFFFRTQTWIRD